MKIEPIVWKNSNVCVIDQTRLPHEFVVQEYDDPEEVARSIETMIVRGAPLIGVTAAFGLALAAQKNTSPSLEEARKSWSRWTERFHKTRPTAVNLFWAIDRMKKVSARNWKDVNEWKKKLLSSAQAICAEDILSCELMGNHGQVLIPNGAKILTHCNAGALATAGWGTALGVIRSAVKAGKKVSVWVDETRPFLQGARLTAWEMKEEGIPAQLITDNMAGHFISRGEVDLIIVGADRIASNGDVANKIGTYSLAVLAYENKIPMYVAAPLSTIDLKCSEGSQIPIEERAPKEVTEVGGQLIAPEGFPARHPAFDVTPSRLITAIITEMGVAKPPFSHSIRELFQQ